MAESLWGATNPTTSFIYDEFAAGGQGYYFGNVIEFSADGEITHVRWYSPPLDSFTSQAVKVWAMNGTVLGSGSGSTTAGQWNDIALTTPVSITNGDLVIVGTDWSAVAEAVQHDYAVVGALGTNGANNGSYMTAPTSSYLSGLGYNGNGRYGQEGGGNTYPALNYNNEGYGCDCVFVPDTGAANLVANEIVSATVVGSPAITQTHVLTATALASASVVGTPALTQAHVLTASGLESASVLGTPALTTSDTLVALELVSAAEVGTPTLTQVHALTATELAAATVSDGPGLTQLHELTVGNIVVPTSTGTPALTQVHGLTASGLDGATEVGAPALTQAHELSPIGLASASLLGSPTLAETGALEAVFVVAETDSGSPALTQTHVLVAQDLVCESDLGSPGVSGPAASLTGYVGVPIAFP